MTPTKLHVPLETVIDNLSSAVIVLDSNTTILLANKMATIFARRAKEEFIGLRCGEAFQCVHAHDDPRGCGHSEACGSCMIMKTVDTTIREEAGRQNVETVMEFKGPGERILRISTTFIDTEEIVIMAVDDMTIMRELEKDRIDKQKLMVAVETGGAVCHEMNQPLQVISGYLDLLLMDTDRDDPRHELLTYAREQTTKMGEITRKLMNIQSYRTRRYFGDDSILDINQSCTDDDISIHGGHFRR